MTEPQNQENVANSQDAGVGAGVAESIGVRNLKIIIIAMPFVFMAAVAAVIAIFGPPGANRGAEEVAAVEAASVEVAAIENSEIVNAAAKSIAIPAGTRPGAMSLDGDRLALRFDGADGSIVVIYDIAEQRVVDQVTFANP